ncbi:type II toxin-antitoxin system VapC family toxin [Azohydromonas aeria]|uniref:type II toxin-antitoxin system VapC family toxin n=1 Tax=Azohydromonas aeria TaxID=2590212 RepID=UPI0012F7723A|nr:type II toxin-antitoxin system VapC family toxin [Azohydromonas aeria]
MYLLDTNVVSELRKRTNANWGVRRFFEAADPDALFLPAQVIGEIRAGIAKLRRRSAADDLKRAMIYDAWLTEDLLRNYGERIIEFDADCAMVWGELLSGEKKDPHTIDKQIAAMALIRDMTVVTRDRGASFCTIPGLKLLNPFADPPSGLVLAGKDPLQ